MFPLEALGAESTSLPLPASRAEFLHPFAHGPLSSKPVAWHLTSVITLPFVVQFPSALLL